jgi:hypothetical protein
MKKIGITTFHRSYNCGSIMQAYALQKILVDKFYLNAEFIDFSNQGQRDLYTVFDKRIRLRSILKNLILLVFSKRLFENNRSYEKYITAKLKLSIKNYSKTMELDEEKLNYDIYLAGSDQVWNITIPDSDDAYFLPFINNHRKIAYAVSQGAKNINSHSDDPDKYKKMINKFDYLSVREPNGQKWLKDDFGISSTKVLDPTLLLDSNDYANIEDLLLENLKKDEYIFVYATELNNKFESMIRKKAKEENLKIVIWQPYTWIKIAGWSKGYMLPKEQNPGKYLTLMKNAKYVFTASFHGAVFAMQYRKNFWILHNDGMDIESDDRILSLLDNFNFTNRIINGNEDIAKLNVSPDYKYFVSKLATDRKKSFDFLKKALK